MNQDFHKTNQQVLPLPFVRNNKKQSFCFPDPKYLFLATICIQSIVTIAELEFSLEKIIVLHGLFTYPKRMLYRRGNPTISY